MDPNRDFVHIDEVFQRLHQTPYSETDASEAWSRMKGLLDEEMPVHPKRKPLVKRKYFYPFLLLIASATVSGTVWGYKTLNSYKNTNIPVSGLSKIGNNSPNEKPTSPKNPTSAIAMPIGMSNSSENHIHDEALQVASLSDAVRKAALNKKSTHSFAPKAPSAPKQHKSGNSSPIAINSTGSSTIRKDAESTNNGTINALQQNDVQASNFADNEFAYKIIHQQLKPENAKSNNKAITINQFTEPILTQSYIANSITDWATEVMESKDDLANLNTNTITPLPKDNGVNNENNKITSNILSIEEQPKFAMQSGSINAVKPENERLLNGQKFVKDENGQWYKESVKTVTITNKIKSKDKESNIETITVVGNSTMNIIDRLPADEVELVELLAIDNATNVNTTIEINNFSAVSNRSNSYSNLKILNENKVKTIYSNAGNNFNNNIKALRDDIARFFQNSDKLQAAINFGGLYTPAGTGGYGFNIGVGGTYLLSERLQLTLEARYIHKSFTNFYIEDIDKTYNVTQNGSIYNGTERITNQEYLISGISMFEVPLYLTYNIGERLSVFGGLQFAYAAPIKWSTNTNVVFNENYANTQKPIDKEFRINDKTDFAAQNGLGYMFGIGFDISKKMSLDFRVNQNFRSNSATGMSNSVNNIFTTPTFNINIGFWFGKKQKIYYLSNR